MPFGVSITCNVSPFETRSFARISFGKTTPVEFPTVVSFSAFIMTVIMTCESRSVPDLPLFPVKDGYITVPDKPGLGIDLEPEIVKRYRVG